MIKSYKIPVYVLILPLPPSLRYLLIAILTPFVSYLTLVYVQLDSIMLVLYIMLSVYRAPVKWINEKVAFSS